MLRKLDNLSSPSLSQCMRRSNSSKTVCRPRSAGQEAACVTAYNNNQQQQQQGSMEQQPMLLLQQQKLQTNMTGRQPWHVKALSAINESTKWTVSAAVFEVLLWQHNEYAAWCVVGAVFSSFICKVLKHVINQERPDNAQKSDPGMPSSHANSLNFLSVYAALSLVYHTGSHATAVNLAAGSVLLGAFLTWLRVRLGYHTWPQVLVGAVLGAGTATAWFKLGTTAALPALRKTTAGIPALYAVTLLAMAAFGVKNILSWAEERKQRWQKQQEQLLQQQELAELQQKLAGVQQGEQQQEQQQQGVEQPVVFAAAWAT